jgi:hypothetical protein
MHDAFNSRKTAWYEGKNRATLHQLGEMFQLRFLLRGQPILLGNIQHCPPPLRLPLSFSTGNNLFASSFQRTVTVPYPHCLNHRALE